tara:strand:+ start:1375 stop:2127 length:753 start_codon:yes stop_codon:yes gene_type:complete
MKKIVLLRHGESVFNKENLFTGWTDVDLSERGIKEARNCGQLLLKENLIFDVAFTSVLKRAIRTLWITLDEMDQMWVPINHSWRLNERHYGALQGLNKAETAAKYGEDKILAWRRSYDIKPPALTPDDSRYPGLDPKYRNLTNLEIPLTECLQDTENRFLPYWKKSIVPVIELGQQIIIVAHGNSLRAIVKYLDDISNDDILDLNIPTGIPLVYELDDNLKPIRNYYLGDQNKVKEAKQATANQGKIESG